MLNYISFGYLEIIMDYLSEVVRVTKPGNLLEVSSVSLFGRN